MRRLPLLIALLIAALIASVMPAYGKNQELPIYRFQQIHDSGSKMEPDFVHRCNGTVVFAIDRDLTRRTPGSWSDLEKSNLVCGIRSNDHIIKRIMVAACAYSMDGPDYSSSSAYRYLRRLCRKGRFKITKKRLPVTICADFQAAEMKLKGRNIKIIVPEDGTLSFPMGGASSLSDKELIEMGYRLSDGSCLKNIYPDLKDYRSAIEIQDYHRFHQETAYAERDLRRQVTFTRILSPSDPRSNILTTVILSILIMMWVVSAVHRSPQKMVRNYMCFVATVIISWLYLSMFKYMLTYDPAIRMLWYTYYIFITGLPLSLLYIVTVFDQKTKHIPIFLKIFMALYPLMVLMVYTNDLTHLVFYFPDGFSDLKQYDYRTGYFIIFAYCFIMLFSALAILIKKSRRSPKKKAAKLPIIVAILLVGYHAGYVVKIPLCRDTNFTMMYCIQAVMFLETLISSKMIPSNTHYKELFSMSPLHMRILDSSCNTVLSSEGSDGLNRMELQAIANYTGHSFYRNPSTIIHSKEIQGGYAVWEEDVTLINQINKVVEENIKNIENANMLLLREQNIKKKKISVQVDAQLFSELEEEIAGKVNLLKETVKDYEECNHRQYKLSYITLQLCNIKRHCNLFFYLQLGNVLPAYEFTVYLDELSEFAGYGGVHSLVRCGSLKDIDVDAAILLYDFYFILICWSMEKSHATLIGMLRDSDRITFTIIASESLDSLAFAPGFMDKLHKLKGHLMIKSFEDGDVVTLIIDRKKDSI